MKSQRCPVTSQSRFEDLLILRDIVECNRDSHMSSRRDTTITMFGWWKRQFPSHVALFREMIMYNYLRGTTTTTTTVTNTLTNPLSDQYTIIFFPFFSTVRVPLNISSMSLGPTYVSRWTFSNKNWCSRRSESLPSLTWWCSCLRQQILTTWGVTWRS